MCFAPYISLSTFVLEFLLAIFFLLKNPKDNLNRIIALLCLLLGVYQLNEFLICITDVHLFTILALSVSAILPPIAISYALIMWRKRLKYYWHLLIYSPSVFFILMFSLSNYLEESAACMTIFIEYPALGILGRFYGLYYFVYILAATVLFYLASSTIKSVYEKRLLYLGMLGMFIFTVPTAIFLIFLPMMYVQFASILCEFALLLAIEFIIVLWYKNKHKINYIVKTKHI